MKIQLQLFLAFLKVGLLGYGGGPSSIPLVHVETVERYKWMDRDEFADILALGNALPGPIATKMAGYIGYRMGGWLGMLNAVAATIVPTILLMIFVLTALNAFKDNPMVAGMAQAVVPIVAVMLGSLTWDFIRSAGTSALGWRGTSMLLAASLVCIQWLHIHPAILIGVLIVTAFIKK
ncbi:chromate transporter [Cytobacillus gottheilii]|uniref:chromate transporter n=1 Tax=Cytobacillus gottheilii TaxID=859144 RepID=UPI001594258E|nr:chromate transporter [Cytobacillus gottheilii]